MKTKNWLIPFHIIITFLYSFGSYSQEKNKEAAPLFILQGAVKIKGKPAEDVSLVLEKSEKQIAKNTTPKSGIYYFQMAKSNSDANCEYQLNIIKSGIAEGILLINTYIPKDEFTPLPYVFNLEIGLTAPTEGASTIEKRDFGKIRWFSEKKAFDFDKEYAITVEKEKQRKKEMEREKAITDSVIAEQEKIEFAKKAEQQKLDSIANEIKNKTATEIVTTNTNSQTNTSNKSTKNTSTTSSKNNKTNNSNTSNKENNSVNTNTTASNNNAIENTNNSIAKKKNQETNTAETNYNQKLNTNKHSNSQSNKTNETENNATNKTTNNALSKNGVSGSSPNNPKEGTNVLIKGGNNITKPNITETQTATNASANPTKVNSNTNSAADTSYTNSSTKRDLFFLTGVPMGQFKRNLVDANIDANNTFDTDNLVDLTNERNRLMNEKARMARKKAENFAKKHETNNTLTSLLNIVDEYEKR